MRRILAGLAMLLAAPALAQSPEERWNAALQTLGKHCEHFCGYGINDSAEERAALDALWDASEAWTVGYLNAHPGASLAAINRELRRRHKQENTDIAPDLVAAPAPGLYGFTVSWDWNGHAFAVAKRDGRFVVVWDIRKAETPAAPILKAWRSENARKDCEKEPADWRDDCGPIRADDFKPLPPDGQGHARFALLATYGQLAETTVGGQLSIWSWDGSAVRLSWAKPYTYNFEQTMWKLEGETLRLRTTGWWHTIFSCGTCIGRQMNWTLHLRPNGIDDLAEKPVVPELDAFDDLAWRIFKGESTDDLATPDVRAGFLKVIKAVKAQDEETSKTYKEATFDPKSLSFGMFGYKVRPSHGARVLELNADDLEFLGITLRLVFQRRGERLFATSISQAPINTGEKPAAAIP